MKLNLIPILFVVCIIVLVSILINVLYARNSLVIQHNLASGLIPIPINTVKDYQSNVYFYEIWIYANSVGSAASNTDMVAATNPAGNIFYVDNSISLDLYKNTSLYVNVYNSSATNKYNAYMVTSEFPLQKWQQVIIHVQHYLMDFYLNGKLVKSTELTSANGVQIPSSSASINFGKTNAYIAKFNRLTSILNTNIAWQRYLQGNATMVPMHASLSLTTDPEKSVTNYKLF